jgi:sec-independent protein translocase protein TatB
MFEVGFTEIILILGIALVVLGPEKLPKVAADIGRWLGRARAMARQLKSQLDEEVIKADRNWSQPQPKKPSPKPAEPQPAADPPAETGAAASEAPAADDTPAGGVPADGTPAGVAAADPDQAGAQPDTGSKPAP